MKIYTVAKAQLLKEADQAEAYANSSLRAWIILGDSEKYAQEMAQVRALRSAADAKSVWVRRDILRNAGFTV